MRLISKFRDYYDTALGYGIDPNVIYKRETESISYPLAKTILKSLPSRGRHDYSYGRVGDSYDALPFVVGFCGKLYLGYKLSVYSRKYCVGYENSKFHERICWSVEDIEAFLIEFELENSFEKFNESIKKDHTRWYVPFKKYHVLLAQKTLNETKELFDIFYNFKVPCFKLHGEDKLTINPELKPIRFYELFDAYSTFQEISMYLGGVLGVGTPETVTVSDKTLALKHGCDKTSFRTISCGKKFNRRNK